jgi:CheY-like chemotaxis protein
MESLGHLAGGVAHDMNNVLSAILGLASAHLDTQPEGSSLHSALQTITKACLRGRNMVKSLLDFARHDMAGERPISLNTLVEEEARLLERSIPANIRISLDLEAGIGSILGDPDSLSLTLMNLCVNAVDAMPEGGSLRFKTRRLPGNLVLLSVQDTGTGMPSHVLEHATDPFFTTKPHGKGTGLGLSLAYSTVKAHHGDLRIKSAPGQGTTIELQFPCAASNETATFTRDLIDSPSTTQSLQILLVDDDDLIQSAVSMQLEALGHQPIVAASGEDALDMVGKGLSPDIVILDMNMPGWGGARTLPKLREALPGVPIFLSTGRLDQQAIDLSRAHPGVSILPKPFGFQELGAAFAGIRPAP